MRTFYFVNRDIRKIPGNLLAWLLGRDVPRHHWRRYALGGFLSVCAVLGTCTIYLAVTPKQYTSQWSVILPGAGVNTRVALDRIGQAQSNASSPFSAKGMSPRVNYKEIATSDPVFQAVAERLRQPVETLRKPRAKLIKQSSIIEFKVIADSPEAAQKSAWAFHQALEDRLNKLRRNEMALRNRAIRNSVNNVEKNLAVARKNLLQLQLASGLTSIDQYKQMIQSIENLRVEQAGLKARLAEKAGLVRSLVDKLGIRQKDATPLFLLSTDPAFRDLLKTLAVQRTTYIDLASRLGSDHPRVLEASHKRTSLADEVESIARRRGGDQLMPAMIDLVSADHDRVVELLSELIKRQSELSGLNSRNETIKTLLVEHEERRVRLGKVAAKLDDLERDHQIANAVFGSALARMDASKSDIYASYPLLQLLHEPSLPATPSSPQKIFAVIGGTLGSLLAVMAWTFAWLHQWFAAIRLTRRSYSPQFA